ncbi:hypothetical protein LJR220_002007 [Bradyrhizobium sp. LjRoot220]|uniref:hypothetical protein n=1 Tax=Bradyrhizobium sp. LjRoot220 TaxID=3342284 RepID=UPI003ECF9E9B
MNTARIVVLTNAIGAGGIAAYSASGSDYRPAASAGSNFISRANEAEAMRDIAGSVENKTDEQPNRRGESISVVRYIVASQRSMQK